MPRGLYAAGCAQTELPQGRRWQAGQRSSDWDPVEVNSITSTGLFKRHAGIEGVPPEYSNSGNEQIEVQTDDECGEHWPQTDYRRRQDWHADGLGQQRPSGWSKQQVDAIMNGHMLASTQPLQHATYGSTPLVPTVDFQDQHDQMGEVPCEYAYRVSGRTDMHTDVGQGEHWPPTDDEWGDNLPQTELSQERRWQADEIGQNPSDWDLNYSSTATHDPHPTTMQQPHHVRDDTCPFIPSICFEPFFVVTPMSHQQILSPVQRSVIHKPGSTSVRRDASLPSRETNHSDVSNQVARGSATNSHGPQYQPTSSVQPLANVEQGNNKQVSVRAPTIDSHVIDKQVIDAFAIDSPQNAPAPEEAAAPEQWDKLRIWRVVNLERDDEASLPVVSRAEPFPADTGRVPPKEMVIRWLRNGDMVKQTGHSKKIRGHMVMPVRVQANGEPAEGWVMRRRMARSGAKVWFEEISGPRR